MKDGLFVNYWDNGNKKHEENNKDGKSDGLETWWYENGQKKEEGNYGWSGPHGLWTYWDKNGNITKTENYKHGLLFKRKKNPSNMSKNLYRVLFTHRGMSTQSNM